MTRSRLLPLLLVAIAALQLGACAPQRTPEEIARVEETNDPWESWNRTTFAVNETLDRTVMRPLAMWYRFLVPVPEARDTIRRVIDNAALPWVMANELMQGEFARAQVTSTRFLINTTLGLGGAIDWATRWGYPQHYEDFGLTLARRFGVRDGPYFVMVAFGPASSRDAWATWVDVLGNPVGWLLPFDGIDRRSRHLEEVDELRAGSLDFYATVRSMTRQRRRAVLNRGDPPVEDVPRADPDAAAPAAVAQAPRVARPSARSAPPAAPWVVPVRP